MPNNQQNEGSNRQKKFSQINKLLEQCKPRKMDEGKRQGNLESLFNLLKGDMDYYIKTMDGCRALCIIYRRGNDEIRKKFMDIFLEKYAIQAAKSKYQYHILLTIIRHKDMKYKQSIFEILCPEISELVRHKIGVVIVNAIFEKYKAKERTYIKICIFWNTFNGKYKLSYNDIEKCKSIKTGNSQKDSELNFILKVVDELEKVILKGKPEETIGKKSSRKENKKELDYNKVKAAVIAVNQACDKRLGSFKVIQVIMDLLVDYLIDKDLLMYGKMDISNFLNALDLGFTNIGRSVILKVLPHVSSGNIRAAIKLLEPHELLPPPTKAQKEEDVEEDVDIDNEMDADEEEENNESIENEEEHIELSNTAKLVNDKNGTLVLTALLLYYDADDREQIILEVIANIVENYVAMKSDGNVQESVEQDNLEPLDEEKNSFLKLFESKLDEKYLPLFKEKIRSLQNSYESVHWFFYNIIVACKDGTVPIKNHLVNPPTFDLKNELLGQEIKNLIYPKILNEIKIKSYYTITDEKYNSIFDRVYAKLFAEVYGSGPDNVREAVQTRIYDNYYYRLTSTRIPPYCTASKGGRSLIIELANDDLLDALITPENIRDVVIHKAIRSLLQAGIGADRVINLISSDEDLVEVLNTPGAWLIKELLESDKSLEERAKSLIKKHNIEQKSAIESILAGDNSQEKNKEKQSPKKIKKVPEPEHKSHTTKRSRKK